MAPPAFLRAVSCGPYEGRMRDTIHALKYGGLHAAAPRLGRMLATAIGQLADEAPSTMLVIPVPLHRSKHVQRGFNQARLLARHAMIALRASHPAWHLTLAPRAVVRHRATESQAGLSPRQRRQNVRGAFLIPDPAVVAGKHILVIDDIFTTGSTARALAAVLLRSGAESVRVATLARARLVFNCRGGRKPVYLAKGNIPDPGAGPTEPDSLQSSIGQPSF